MLRHFITSMIKSFIRIGGGIATIVCVCFGFIETSIITLASSLGFAELLGILEELLDERK